MEHFPTRHKWQEDYKTSGSHRVFGLRSALSSAVEHQYHTLGVAGSNPAARTIPTVFASRAEANFSATCLATARSAGRCHLLLAARRGSRRRRTSYLVPPRNGMG